MFQFQYSFIKKRIYGPVIWNLMFQATVLNAFTFFINADFLNPVQWFYEWYIDFIWRGYFLYIIPLTFIVVTQGCVCIEDYTKTQPFYATRWSLIKQILCLHNVILCLLYMSVGFLIPWIYSSMAGDEYVNFLYDCYNGRGTCFSEKKFFLVSGGMVINVIYFFRTYFLGTRYLAFPITQLPKVILIKGLFLQTFQDSAKSILIPTLSFVFLYYLRGGLIRNILCYTFSWGLETQRLDSIVGVLNVKLLIYLLLFSSIVVVSMSMMELFFKVSLTERFIFSISTSGHSSISLCESLQRSDCPIVQHLAFLDLMLLSQHNKSRREEIFKLSDFGGHPFLWNNIKKECLVTIQEFSDSLEENLKLPTQPKEPPKPPRPPEMKRNVTNYFIEDTNRKLFEFPPKFDRTAESIRPNYVFQLSEVQKERLYSFPFMLYFLGDRKDMRIRHTLKQNLIVIWACEALSFLACHSLSEDKYGILVNDIPQILMNLLRLKWILDTLLKQSMLANTLGRQDVLNTIRGTAIKKSVKRSIYRIVRTFKHYINDLHLSKETEAQLLPYLTYRE